MWPAGNLHGRRRKEAHRVSRNGRVDPTDQDGSPGTHVGAPTSSSSTSIRRRQRVFNNIRRRGAPILVGRIKNSRFYIMVKRRPKIQVLFFLLSFAWIASIFLLHPLSLVLLGPAVSREGGLLGIFIDVQLKKYLMRRTEKRRKERLLALGVKFPPPPLSPLASKVGTVSDAALGETTIRAIERELNSKESGKHVGIIDGYSVGIVGQGSASTGKNMPATNNVTISLTSGRDRALQKASQPKTSIEELMLKTGCEPTWLCNRCLRAATHGTFPKCSFVCRKCHEKLICSHTHEKANDEVTVEVTVKRINEDDEQMGQRIPRIVHQTWFEELTPHRYPQLVRLQNSWRMTGWEYRFYTDESSREYIQHNFPSLFVDVYDTLVPGAFKADFFRYLVLLKEGGIYADVDVMLDGASLDSFITEEMAFFVPRDAVGEYMEENFCLWNGLIGSAPAHPFLVRVVERMVNLVRKRADMFDIEREFCVEHGRESELWKIRAEPGLLLSGPCALGVSVNEAMGNAPLAKFDVGWLQSKHIGRQNGTLQERPATGDVLILLQDKWDLGAMRFSDPERDIIFASTDMPGLSKAPIVSTILATERKQTRKEKAHYSAASKGQWVWGSRYVYRDKMVSNERIKLLLSYHHG